MGLGLGLAGLMLYCETRSAVLRSLSCRGLVTLVLVLVLRIWSCLHHWTCRSLKVVLVLGLVDPVRPC